MGQQGQVWSHKHACRYESFNWLREPGNGGSYLQKWESETQKLGQLIKPLPGCCANTNQTDSSQFSSVKGESSQLFSGGHPAVIQGCGSTVPVSLFKRHKIPAAPSTCSALEVTSLCLRARLEI